MRTVLSLNAKWAFTKQADSIPSAIDNKWNFVNLPHSWNAIDGQDGDNDYFRGTGYYAKTITKTELPPQTVTIWRSAAQTPLPMSTSTARSLPITTAATPLGEWI